MTSTHTGRFNHLVWANQKIQDALAKAKDALPDSEQVEAAEREFAHVVGAEETWLARIQGRKPRLSVWPDERGDDLARNMDSIHEGYRQVLTDLDHPESMSPVQYTNSAGLSFSNSVEDILEHVSLHGQYHRGKINHLLREIGMEPAPVDFIAFVRGVAAATQKDAERNQTRNR